MTDMRSISSGAGGSGRSFGTRAITAMFDSRSDAEEAVNNLIEAGFAKADVRLVPGHEKDADTTAFGASSGMAGSSTAPRPGTDTAYRGHEEGRGFWESLSDFFFPEEDRHSYAEGLRRGGYLVTVNTTEANHAKAVDILDDEGTIDLDEREDQWRSQGWGGYSGSSDTGASSVSSTSTSTPGVGYTGVGSSGSGGSVMGTGGLGSTSSVSGGTGASSMDASSAGSTRLDADVGVDRGTRMGSTLGSDDTGAEATSGGYGRSNVPESGGAGLSSTQRERSGINSSGDWATSRGADREGGDKTSIAGQQRQGGGREADGGRMRVRSYLVDRPSEEQVSLRRERAGSDTMRKTDVDVNDQRSTSDDASRRRL